MKQLSHMRASEPLGVGRHERYWLLGDIRFFGQHIVGLSKLAYHLLGCAFAAARC
jgi:hypothetical protein